MIYDISLPVSERLAVWPGDTPVAINTSSTIAENQSAVSQICLSSHAGTHVDPPAHFIPGGATTERLPLEVMLGPARVIHFAGPGPIGASWLAGQVPPDTQRLLLRTDNSEQPNHGLEFDEDYVALAPDAAAWLIEAGVRLIGTDGPSIDPFTARGFPAHHLLLAAGVVIVENLRLAQVGPGIYQLCCLPLPLLNGDGAPARAVLVRDA